VIHSRAPDGYYTVHRNGFPMEDKTIHYPERELNSGSGLDVQG